MKIAVLTLLLALLPAAAASAQAPPPDERVAAQAFADAAKRFESAAGAAATLEDDWLEPCEPLLERIPRAHAEDALVLTIGYGMRRAFADMREPLRAFRSELANVRTADPVLVSGRAAVRWMGRALESIPAPGRFCAGLRAWRRAGYPRSATRAEEAALEAVGRAMSPGVMRKIESTALRLRELGVSRSDAQAFGGEAGW